MSSRSTQIIGGPDREHAFVDTATNALLVKVVNPGGGTGSNVNIAEVGGTAIGSTVPVSDGGGSLTVDGTVAVSSISGSVTIAEPVSVDDNGGSLTVDGTVAVSSVGGTVVVGDGGGSITVDGTLSATLGGLVSTGNATTTPLGSNATYTGTWEDVTNYATITVTVYANVPSATDGMKFEWSGNGVNIDEAESITISAAHPGRAMSLNVRGRYFRIVYTNGGTAQTTFRLGTVYRPSGIGANNHPITDDLEDTTLAIMTRSVIVGETTGGGGGGYENVKVTPSGALTVEINDGGGSITVDGTVAVSSVSGTVTVGDGGGSLTVDGTVAATQSGAWTVSVNEPVSVDDNGGSLTVDGTVAVSSVGGTVVVGDGGGSLTVDGTVAATQSGSWTVTAAQATHNNLNANANIQVGDVDVGNANPVPVSDAGGSLTVDGTVAVSSVGGTVTVTGTVSVNDPVSVDDNGGSLTVDGTVAVSSVSGTVTVADGGGSLTVDGTVAATQSGSWTVTAAQTTHDNLNANANIQVGDADVGNLNPVPVSDAGGSLTVDGTVAVSSVGGTVTVTGTVTAAQATHDNLNLNANLQVNNTDVSNTNRVPISDGNGSITVDGSVSAEVYSSGTGYTMQVYKQGDAPPATVEAPSLLFYATSDPVSNPGIADTRWTPAFVDSASGGIYVQVAGGSLDATVSSIIPGTGTTNLGKAEDTAHVSGSTGVMPLAVRNDSMTVFAGPNGDYIPFSTDAVGRLQVIKSGGKATYRAATTNNVATASGTTASFFILSGSSTKTITVQRITITCPTLTAVAYNSIVIRKFSTAPTGGTATALTKVPLDSASAASTANICSVYTAAPTDGSPVGTIGCQRSLFQATTAAAAGTPPDPIIWDFRNGFGEASGVILRGVAESIGVSFNPAPASSVTLSVEVEWIEE